ncbi:hypothetical protein BO998_20845 [Citrobacter werkmanii]|nr:hypothetical protein BO998_20845 [Citrobacter werkmanii]
MPEIAIPRLAMVNSITDIAIRRYTEQRQSLPCFLIDDLLQATNQGPATEVGIVATTRISIYPHYRPVLIRYRI